MTVSANALIHCFLFGTKSPMHVDKLRQSQFGMNCSPRTLGRRWRRIQSAQWWSNERKILKKEQLRSILSEEQPQLNWNGGLSVSLPSKMKSFKFTWSAKYSATSLVVDSSVTWDAKLVVSFFIVISCSWMRIMIWCVRFSLASSVKISQRFDCLPLVFCSIKFLGSCVERETFSKTLSEIGNEMVNAGNTNATDIELVNFRTD